jgi:hypothetical protein
MGWIVWFDTYLTIRPCGRADSGHFQLLTGTWHQDCDSVAQRAQGVAAGGDNHIGFGASLISSSAISLLPSRALAGSILILDTNFILPGPSAVLSMVSTKIAPGFLKSSSKFVMSCLDAAERIRPICFFQKSRGVGIYHLLFNGSTALELGQEIIERPEKEITFSGRNDPSMS